MVTFLVARVKMWHRLMQCASPSPISPSVSPLILAAPDATSRICSTLWTLVPSRRACEKTLTWLMELLCWQQKLYQVYIFPKCHNWNNLTVPSTSYIVFQKRQHSKENEMFQTCLFSCEGQNYKRHNTTCTCEEWLALVPFITTQENTNLMQPGGASVQGEDVTECGVGCFLHWGCWHITHCYA